MFGVGFLREYLKSSYARMVDDILAHHPGDDAEPIRDYLHRFDQATPQEKAAMLDQLKRKAKKRAAPELLSREDRKGLRKVYRGELIKRAHLHKIIAAWLITVPASALLGALFFYALRGALLP